MYGNVCGELIIPKIWCYFNVKAPIYEVVLLEKSSVFHSYAGGKVESIIFIGGLSGGISFGAGNLLHVFSWVIDIPSLIAILILSIPILVRKGMWKDFTRAFKMMNKKYSCSIADMKRSQDAIEFAQKQIMYAGIITFILGVIAICGHIDDLSAVGPNMAVAIISVLYTAFLELLLLPVQVEIKGRIIDYMEGE